MEIKFRYLSDIYTVQLEKEGDLYKATINGKEYKVQKLTLQSNNGRYNINDKVFNIFYAVDKERVYVLIDGEYFVFEQEKSGTKMRKTAVGEKGNNVASPMPGLLVKLPVKIGEKIEAGDVLAIVEAMKMQNELRSPASGIVKKINYKEGDQVDAFVPILELELI